MRRNKYFSYFRNELINSESRELTIQELTKNGYKQAQETSKENKTDLNFQTYKKATKQLEKAIGNKQRFNDYNSEHRHKKVIVFSGRVHPGETNSSYWIQGVIDFLVSHSSEAKMLRSYFIFKVIPMLNPDGVAAGNYRWSIIGADLNRRWINPSPIWHPAIFTTKYLIQVFNKEHGVVLYTDFHGHSRK